MENGQKVSPYSDSRSSPLKIWGPPCLVAALIFVLSSTPGAFYPEHPDFLNNIAHFVEFALLGLLLTRALHRRFSLAGTGLFLWTTAICATFGLLDELHQFLVPLRIFDMVDLFFDSMGAATGSGAFILFISYMSGNSVPGTASAGNHDDR